MYGLIIIADILLTVVFACQRKYQKIAGVTLKSGVIYNFLVGLCSAVLFLIINRFAINITVYSVVMAALFSTVIMLYTFIGFKIMEKGNMSLYTLFLMSGGMTVPYLWGVVFLHEEPTLPKLIGLAVIIVAIVVSNSGGKKPDLKQVLLCFAVFFLNGISSVISKTHQISAASDVVSSSDFTFLAMICKSVICLFILLVTHNKALNYKESKIKLKSILPIIVVAATCDGISFMLQLTGAAHLPATVLYPFITGATVVMTSIADVIVFKEKLSVKNVFAVVMCFIGTLMFL